MSETRVTTISNGPTRRGFRARVADALRGFTQGPWLSNSAELARWFGAPPTATGIRLDEASALNLSAVFSATAISSGAVAALPIVILENLPRGGQQRVPSHPLYSLLHDQPCPELTSFTFRQTLQAHALTWGNGYAEI